MATWRRDSSLQGPEGTPDSSGRSGTHGRKARQECRAGTVVYAIRYPDDLSARSGDGLARLAEATGGVLFDPPGNDYAPILRRVELDLRSRYILGFRVENPGSSGRCRQLKVEVARPSVWVRARTEFFDPQ